MGSFSIWHWLTVLIIIALVFGTRKLRNIGSDLGSAVKGFKEGMRDTAPPSQQDVSPPVRTSRDTIEGHAREKNHS